MILSWDESHRLDQIELDRRFYLVEVERREKMIGYGPEGAPREERVRDMQKQLAFARACNAKDEEQFVLRPYAAGLLTRREAHYLSLRVRMNKEAAFVMEASVDQIDEMLQAKHRNRTVVEAG